MGGSHEIQCKVNFNKVINASIIKVTWRGPNNDTILTNNRTTINTTASADNNHTSTLQFQYLIEEDQGLYTCHIEVLNYTKSGFFKLEKFSSKFPTFL